MKPGNSTIPFNYFLDLIGPIFPEKAEKVKYYRLSQMYFFIGIWTILYMSGLLALPKTFKIIRYAEDKNLHQVTDFIFSEGKKIFAQMKDGDNMPPPNWVSKE